MGQSKCMSLIESFSNVLIGIVVAILSQLLVFPWFGIDIPFTDNLLISLCFTVISVIRSYCVRRFFNARDSPKTKPGCRYYPTHCECRGVGDCCGYCLKQIKQSAINK